MPVIKELVVTEFGTFVGKHGGRLRISQGGKKRCDAPLMHLQSLTLSAKGVAISGDAIEACAARGIPIYFINSMGKPYASLYASGLMGTVATRRAQLAAYQDVIGLRWVVKTAMGKLHNQVNLLKYFSKYRKDTQPDLYDHLRESALEITDQLIEIERILQFPEVLDGEAQAQDFAKEIMGHEGLAGKIYWRAVKALIPAQYGFPGRTHQNSRDPVNASLNYGYGILYSRVQNCLVLAGLDPYAGFLHVDRPGKPSLTLDFIETFRQPVVDRTVIALANQNSALTADDSGRLDQPTRTMLAEKVINRLESQVPFEGKRRRMESVIQIQARRLAAYLRRDRLDYQPFQMGW
jgi:CRISPR-associated protein Cas1